jgi:hypothetical protein
MKTLRLLSTGIASLVALMPHAAKAQTASPTFFVSQKVWFASWDYPALNVQLIAPTPQSPTPLAQESISNVKSDSVIPLTTFGANIDKWSLSTSIAPSIRFSDSRLHEGSIRRSEYDVSVGYEVASRVNVALIYKSGKVHSQSLAVAAAADTLTSEQKFKGLLFGVAASKSVADDFSLYGTLAYGPGRGDLSLRNMKVNVKYTIAELGATYRPPALPTLSVQAGYRYQAVRLKDVPFLTYALTPTPVEVSHVNQSTMSRTGGFVLGVSLAF